MKRLMIITFCFGIVAGLQNCSSSKKTTSPVTVVSYEKDLLPIMQTSCTPCHFPPRGRMMVLDNYDSVKNHISDMIMRIKLPHDDKKFMPFLMKRPALSDSFISLFVQWKDQNMPK